MAQESAWIRTCAKHKVKNRPVLYGPKTGGKSGNVTSPGQKAGFLCIFSSGLVTKAQG